MKIERLLQANKNVMAAALLAALILLPLAYYAMSQAVTKVSAENLPFLEKPDPKYQKCLRDAVYMRLHHMDLLLQARNDVVRLGQRGDIRIEKCFECHKNRNTFCNQCHTAANVYLNCFDCHGEPLVLPTNGVK
jgi:hypothetical protein